MCLINQSTFIDIIRPAIELEENVVYISDMLLSEFE